MSETTINDSNGTDLSAGREALSSQGETESRKESRTEWINRFWEFALSKLLKNFEVGNITLRYPQGKSVQYGKPESEPSAYMKVNSHRMIRKLLVEGDVGLAESYMDGDWESSNLVPILELGPRNVDAIENKILGFKFFRLKNLFQHLLRPNSLRGSQRNIADHYDLGNSFYLPWLDRSMTYSSALFEDEHDRNPDNVEEHLYHGQIRKYQYIADQLNLKPGMKVLEIGCGWGGFAEIAARDYGCQVDGITISKEQLAYASKRIQNSGLSKQVNLFFQDYRDLEGKYDRIVSIEMLEAVGEKNWPTYFNQVKQLLKPEGEALIQTILIEDSRFEDYRKKADFIQRYIFPGGMLPSLEILKPIFSEYELKLNDVMHFGNSYGKTMNLWNQMFQNAWSEIQNQNFDLRFKRMWEYYLAYCETGFNTGAIDVAMIHLQKESS